MTSGDAPAMLSLQKPRRRLELLSSSLFEFIFFGAFAVVMFERQDSRPAPWFIERYSSVQIAGGGHPQDRLEVPGEVALIGEAHGGRDVCNVQIAPEQPPRL